MPKLNATYTRGAVILGNAIVVGMYLLRVIRTKKHVIDALKQVAESL